MAGDYSRKRIIYQDASVQANFAATDGNTTLITGKTSYTLYIQRITVTISTSAAQAITFQDSAGSPVYVWKIPASPGVDTEWTWDGTSNGKPLTTAKNLVMAMTAGNAGHVEVEAYLRPDAVA